MKCGAALAPGVSYSQVVATVKGNVGSASSFADKAKAKKEQPLLVNVSEFLRDVAESGGVLDQEYVAVQWLALAARNQEVEAHDRHILGYYQD